METLSRTPRWILLLAALVLAGFGSIAAASSHAESCDKIDIEGTYQCAGECVVTSWEGVKSVIQVTGETDKVERFPGATAELYKITITGGPPLPPECAKICPELPRECSKLMCPDRFHEVEIGALKGLVLRTATAKVSDQHYPVLEEDVFDVDSECKATGYTKIVRNPDPANFKACSIYCKKVSP